MKQVVIAHLYPREMSIYGDSGNIRALVQRLVWRGYDPVVKAVEIGQPFDFSKVDIVFGGGGQDRGQLLVGADLLARGEALRQAVLDGMPMLLVCGLYQLFGREFMTNEGKTISGIGVFDMTTTGSDTRMIGNIVVESPYGRLVGFENHSGATILGSTQGALGKVKKGYGNDPKSRREGAVSVNVIGTYLHGPILPKNPALADYLILQAVRRKYGVTELTPLDDALELKAAKIALSRPQ
ncbi:MAG: glutamine amidotransferase [Candidatus Saccharibacteria bacterium]